MTTFSSSPATGLRCDLRIEQWPGESKGRSPAYLQQSTWNFSTPLSWSSSRLRTSVMQTRNRLEYFSLGASHFGGAFPTGHLGLADAPESPTERLALMRDSVALGQRRRISFRVIASSSCYREQILGQLTHRIRPEAMPRSESRIFGAE